VVDVSVDSFVSRFEISKLLRDGDHEGIVKKTKDIGQRTASRGYVEPTDDTSNGGSRNLRIGVDVDLGKPPSETDLKTATSIVMSNVTAISLKESMFSWSQIECGVSELNLTCCVGSSDRSESCAELLCNLMRRQSTSPIVGAAPRRGGCAGTPARPHKQLLKLQYLILSTNKLTKVPTSIAHFVQLECLRLDQNKLTTLPAEIGQLVKLTELNLWDNQLTTLPSEIGNLSQLKELKVDKNKLTGLPCEIGQLTKLRILQLDQNQLKDLPLEIGNLFELRKLLLHRNQLVQLPTEIGRLEQLTTLALYENHLKELPSQIGQLTQLAHLNVSKNELTTLPVELKNLVQLEKKILYIYPGNQFDTQPESEFKSILAELKYVGICPNREKLAEFRPPTDRGARHERMNPGSKGYNNGSSAKR
jgi:hypothetical protein